MQLLLLKDVSRLGHVGDIVDVNKGYARNYLVPQRLATDPTPENIQAIAEEKKRATAERARRLKEFKEFAAKMVDVQVTIEAAANPEGTLYGSVGPREIAAELQGQGHPVRPEHVLLETAIRTLDNRTVTLRFAEDVEAEIKVWVVRSGASDDVDESEDHFEPDDEPTERERPSTGFDAIYDD